MSGGLRSSGKKPDMTITPDSSPTTKEQKRCPPWLVTLLGLFVFLTTLTLLGVLIKSEDSGDHMNSGAAVSFTHLPETGPSAW